MPSALLDSESPKTVAMFWEEDEKMKWAVGMMQLGDDGASRARYLLLLDHPSFCPPETPTQQPVVRFQLPSFTRMHHVIPMPRVTWPCSSSLPIK